MGRPRSEPVPQLLIGAWIISGPMLLNGLGRQTGGAANGCFWTTMPQRIVTNLRRLKG